MSRVKNDELRFRIKRDYDGKTPKLDVAGFEKTEQPPRPKTPHVKKLKSRQKQKQKQKQKSRVKETKKTENAPAPLAPVAVKPVFTCPNCDKPYKTRRGAVAHVKKCIA